MSGYYIKVDRFLFDEITHALRILTVKRNSDYKTKARKSQTEPILLTTPEVSLFEYRDNELHPFSFQKNEEDAKAEQEKIISELEKQLKELKLRRKNKEPKQIRKRKPKTEQPKQNEELNKENIDSNV